MSVLRTATRFLSFRATHEELWSVDGRHLAFGLVFTWLAGVGRYWDSPSAHLAQSTGLVSLILVFVLAGLLWGVVAPLYPKGGWTYPRVLTFVTLTAPPALLYAIPVERWTTLETARSLNVWFLAIVAAWRVGLFAFLLRRLAKLSWGQLIVAATLPLTLVVTALTMLNLEHAVFNIMAGLRSNGTAADGAYAVLVTLTFFSVLAFVPLLLTYLVLCFQAWRGRRDEPAAVEEQAASV